MQMLATSEKWNHEVMALNRGGRFTRHAGMNQYGRYYVSSLHSIGGSGARSRQDGMDTGGSGVTSNDVEWVELNFPLRYLFRRHITDGAGAGKFRGGTGAEMALSLHDAPEGKIKGIALGVAGLRNSGQGMFGGYPGAPAIMVLHEDVDPERFVVPAQAPSAAANTGSRGRTLPYCEFDLKDRGVLYVRAASGGGYGDPLDRPPEIVLRDVLNGFVSPDAARDIYGVVLSEDGNLLDPDATQELRATCRRERLESRE
jgi:N-methylhydantoinase B